MLDSFFAPKLKVERARKHFSELETETAAFLESRPARFEARVTDGPGTRRFDFTLHFRQPGPLFGAIIGDLIHNLRTALDLAACDLVRWRESNADANVRYVYFPMCARADELEATIGKREFNRAGIAAVDIIRELRPHRDGHPLMRAIHDLDVQDKHTALIVTPISIAGPVIRRWDDDGTMNPTIIGDPTAPSELRVVFPAGTPFAGADILETLRQCIEAIDGLIERFRALAS